MKIRGIGPEVRDEDIWKQGINTEDLRDIMENELNFPRPVRKKDVNTNSHSNDEQPEIPIEEPKSKFALKRSTRLMPPQK